MVGHRLIMEVDDALVDPVKSHVRFMINLQKLADQSAKTGIDTYSDQFNAIQWREEKKHEQEEAV